MIVSPTTKESGPFIWSFTLNTQHFYKEDSIEVETELSFDQIKEYIFLYLYSMASNTKT